MANKVRVTIEEDIEQPLIDAKVAGQKYGMKSVKTKTEGLATFVLGHKDVWKLLRYDVEALVLKGGLRTLFNKGTICTISANFFKHMFKYPVFAGVFWLVAAFLVTDGFPVDPKWASDLVDNITRVTPFILGLYLSLAVGRWWALRNNALGAILNATSNINLLFGCLAPDEKYEESRNMIYRWSQAGVHLVVKAARDIDDIGNLVVEGYLTREEAQHIKVVPKFQRAMVVWAWIARAARETQARGIITGPFLAQLMNHTTKARDGIQTIHTYLDTQLPFAYVHLITLMVSLTNYATAFKCGILLGTKYAEAVEAKEKVDRLLMFNEVLFVLITPLVYDGLLSISYMIHDPFGEDMLDFPVTAYLASVVDNCSSLQHAQESYPGAFKPKQKQEPVKPVAPSPAPDVLPTPARNQRARATVGTFTSSKPKRMSSPGAGLDASTPLSPLRSAGLPPPKPRQQSKGGPRAPNAPPVNLHSGRPESR